MNRDIGEPWHRKNDRYAEALHGDHRGEEERREMEARSLRIVEMVTTEYVPPRDVISKKWLDFRVSEKAKIKTAAVFIKSPPASQAKMSGQINIQAAQPMEMEKWNRIRDVLVMVVEDLLEICERNGDEQTKQVLG